MGCREAQKCTMEGKTLDEQFNDLLNHPLGKRIAEIHIMYAKPAYRNDVWPTYDDYMKKFVIRQIKGIIEKVCKLVSSGNVKLVSNY